MCAEASSGAHPTQTDYKNERKDVGGCFQILVETPARALTVVNVMYLAIFYVFQEDFTSHLKLYFLAN